MILWSTINREYVINVIDHSLTGVAQISSTNSDSHSEHSLPTRLSVKDPQLFVLHNIPWIFAITPTYKRMTQKVDLTSLCQTIQLVQNIVWIVIEDGYLKSDTVSDVLSRCTAKSIHLIARNISEWTSPAGRGVEQRNAGLAWIRKNCSEYGSCNGSFYFMDDDNKYGLPLFDMVGHVVNKYGWFCRTVYCKGVPICSCLQNNFLSIN